MYICNPRCRVEEYIGLGFRKKSRHEVHIWKTQHIIEGVWVKSFGDKNTKRSEKNIKLNVLGADQEQKKKLLKKSVIAITQYRKNTTVRTLYV